jgi:phage gp29-like protein
MTQTELFRGLPEKKKPAEPDDSSPFERLPAGMVAGREPRDLPVSSLQRWDNVVAVRGALVALEQGQFTLAAPLLDAMLGDSHIAAKLDDRVSGVFGSPFSFSPPVGLEDDAAALEVAHEAMEIWPGIVSDQAERAVARDGIMLGVGLGEIVVTPNATAWSVRLKHWHPRFIQWRWDTRAYHVTTMRGVEQLLPDGRGGYYSTWRDSTGQDQVSRWLLFTPYGYQRGWVNARIKAVAIPWLLRMWAFRDWGRHSEILGIPPKKVTVPVQWNDEDKRRALREVASLASEGVILTPKGSDGTGFDVELMELTGPSAKDTFDGLIERSEAAISVALVGQTLTTQASSNGGNRALGQVHERVSDRLRVSDAKALSEVFRAAIFIPWTEWNYTDAKLTPVPKWDVEPAADAKTRGDGMKSVGDGLASLKAAGIPVDRAAICGEYGIPLEEGVDFEEPKPPPAPFGAPGDPAPGEEPGKKPEEDNAEEDDQEAEDGSEKLSTVALSRRTRAPVQGQVYADQLADAARAEASRLLAGDLRAIKRLLAELTPTQSGGVDVEQLREKLVATYKGMDHSQLARMTEKVLVLAALSGRYAVQKEVAAGPLKASSAPDLGAAMLAAAVADRPPATVTFQRGPDGRVLGATITTDPPKE